MEHEFDEMMRFGELNLYYEVHMADLDGECFDYSVYFENLTDEKINAVHTAIQEFTESYEPEYLGYLNIEKKEDNKLEIYLDLGNVNPSYEDVAIKGILKALHRVSDIKCVIINE